MMLLPNTGGFFSIIQLWSTPKNGQRGDEEAQRRQLPGKTMPITCVRPAHALPTLVQGLGMRKKLLLLLLLMLPQPGSTTGPWLRSHPKIQPHPTVACPQVSPVQDPWWDPAQMVLWDICPYPPHGMFFIPHTCPSPHGGPLLCRCFSFPELPSLHKCSSPCGCP